MCDEKTESTSMPNYQMVQSVTVLKKMIDVRDCVKECVILNMDDVSTLSMISV